MRRSGNRACFILTAICLLLLTGIFPAGRAFADQEIRIDAGKQFSYAQSLFESRDFGVATAEFKRFLHFFPDHPKAPEAHFLLGMSLYEDRKLHAALSVFDAHTGAHGDNALSPRARIMAAKCRFRLNDPRAAFSDLEKEARTAKDPALAGTALYEAGWLYLEIGAFEPARTRFERIDPSLWGRYRIPELIQGVEGAKELPRKSPEAAGWLSILPGAGYFYLGRYQDAAVAFILNGATIFAAVQAFDDENYALGGLLTALEAGFYTGGIIGSVSSAKKFNRQQEAGYVERLQGFRVELSALPLPGGAMVALSIPF